MRPGYKGYVGDCVNAFWCNGELMSEEEILCLNCQSMTADEIIDADDAARRDD